MTFMPIHDHLTYLADERSCTLLLHVPDIEGSSTLQEYEGWIPVDAISSTWTMAHDESGSGSRRRRGAVTPARVILRLAFDGAGVDLVRASLQGRSFPEFELHHVSVTDEVRTPLRQEFRTVVIQGTRTDSVGALPNLQMEFSYEAVHMTWTEVEPDGSDGREHSVEWDVKTGS